MGRTSWCLAAEAGVNAGVESLRRAAADLDLIGGLAVSARAEPRYTRALDLAVAVPISAWTQQTLAGRVYLAGS